MKQNKQYLNFTDSETVPVVRLACLTRIRALVMGFADGNDALAQFQVMLLPGMPATSWHCVFLSVGDI